MEVTSKQYLRIVAESPLTTGTRSFPSSYFPEIPQTLSMDQLAQVRGYSLEASADILKQIERSAV